MDLKALLFRLADVSVHVPASDNEEFWAPYWSASHSAAQVFNVLEPQQIRYIRDCSLTNFCSLLQAVATHVVHLCGQKKTPIEKFPRKELLNCLRLLSKFLPYLYEMSTLEAAERELFWTSHRSASVRPPASDSSRATVGSASSHFSSSNDPSSKDSTTVNVDFNTHSVRSDDSTRVRYDDQNVAHALPLGAQLVDCATSLLFTAGFTTRTPAGDMGLKMNMADFTVWESGMGDDRVAYDVPSVDLDCHRVEVIRFLLCLCSQCLYKDVRAAVPQGSRYLLWLVTSTPKLRLLSLLSSLINVTCRSVSHSETNGMSFESVSFKELRTVFVTNCIQLLTLMLVCPIPKEDPFINMLAGTSNFARLYCGQIRKPADIVLITNALLGHLMEPISRESTDTSTFSHWMKSKLSTPQPAVWAVERIMLLWEFYQVNRRFRHYVSTKYGPKLLIALLYHVWTFRNIEAKKLGMVRLALFLMLFLLADPNMCRNMLLPFDKAFYDGLPPNFKPPIAPTTYRDFLVIQISSIVCSECPPSLYPTLIQMVYNCLPMATVAAKAEEADEISSRRRDMKSMSYPACASVVRLVTKMSSPEFLEANDMHADLLALIIRSICHCLCRDRDHSNVLLYVLTKNAAEFESAGESITKFSQKKEKQEEEAEEETEGTESPSSPPPPSAVPLPIPSVLGAVPIPAAKRNSISRQDTRESTPSQSASRVSSVMSTDNLVETLTLVESEISRNQDAESIISGPGGVQFSDPFGNSSEYVKPKLPVGMSERAKSKLPLYASLEDTWPASQGLRIILTIAGNVLMSSAMGGALTDGSTAVKRIAKLDFTAVLKDLKIPDEYNAAKTSFEPLKFTWSPTSLGWYEAMLWAEIYVSYNINSNHKLLDGLSSSITSFKNASAGWGLWGGGSGSRRSSRSTLVNSLEKYSGLGLTESELKTMVENTSVLTGVWSGTFIRLFRVNRKRERANSVRSRMSQTSVSVDSLGQFNRPVMRRDL